MTRKEAIWILDPETTGEEISKIEYYGGFRGRPQYMQYLMPVFLQSKPSGSRRIGGGFR